MNPQEVYELILDQDIKYVDFYIGEIRFASYPTNKRSVSDDLPPKEIAVKSLALLNKYVSITSVQCRRFNNESLGINAMVWEVTHVTESGAPVEPIMNEKALRKKILAEFAAEEKKKDLQDQINELNEELKSKPDPLQNLSDLISRTFQTLGDNNGWFANQQTEETMQGNSDKAMNEAKENQSQDEYRSNDNKMSEALEIFKSIGVSTDELLKLAIDLKENPAHLTILRTLI